MIQELVNNKIDALMDEIVSKYGNIMDKPTITFDLKCRSAGRAFASNRIQFNNVLLSENLDTFLETTVPHELAHILAYKLYGTFAHDKFWKRTMLFLGAEPNRCHQYDTTNAKVRTVKKVFEYHCACNKHMLTSIRHNRMVQQGIKYRCGLCKQYLVMD